MSEIFQQQEFESSALSALFTEHPLVLFQVSSLRQTLYCLFLHGYTGLESRFFEAFLLLLI